MAGTLERNTSAAVPEGEMSSVDTLSPSFRSTVARSDASTGRPRGTGLMLGPFSPSVADASAVEAGGGRPHAAAGRGGIVDHAGQCGVRRSQRRAEIDLIILDAAAAGEVAVERAQALAPGGGHVPDGRAGAAGGLGPRQ